jgi:hypothetical protein
MTTLQFAERRDRLHQQALQRRRRGRLAQEPDGSWTLDLTAPRR